MLASHTHNVRCLSSSMNLIEDCDDEESSSQKHHSKMLFDATFDSPKKVNHPPASSKLLLKSPRIATNASRSSSICQSIPESTDLNDRAAPSPTRSEDYVFNFERKNIPRCPPPPPLLNLVSAAPQTKKVFSSNHPALAKKSPYY